jgi:hypothetical protein
MKVIIFDASTLISLAMNGLFNELSELKKKFNGKFIIPKEVHYEIIERPVNVKRFEFEALKLKELVDNKVLEFPSSIGIKDEEISKRSKEILDLVNNTFIARDKPVHLIDSGESAVLALASILKEKKISMLVAVDERTTRVMCEAPKQLIKLLERKLHTNIKIQKENFSHFGYCGIIRSAELVYLMWKKGIVKMKDPRVLDALLYAVKFKGCSITDDEIKEIKGLR